MTYDPIAKKAYDKERNAKIKAEYLLNNPNYKSTRTAQKEQSEERKRKYLDSQRNPPHQQPIFFQTLNSQITQPHQNNPTTKPKEKYNPNSIMRKKSDDEYDDEKTPIVQPKPIFFY